MTVKSTLCIAVIIKNSRNWSTNDDAYRQ